MRRSRPLFPLLVAAALAGSAAAQTAPAIDVETGELVTPQSAGEDIARRQASCRLAPADANDTLVIHGAYEGQAVSTAALAGQDTTTLLTEVEIEPGERPLYLVLNSYTPMVWRFRGDTGRVAKVAVISGAGGPGRPGAGVVGLPGAKVRAFHASECFGHFAEAGSLQAHKARAFVHAVLGRNPDAVTANYGAARVALPSGRTAQAGAAPPAPRGLDGKVWPSALRFYPAGLAQVDPAQVVGGRAEAYQVLPGRMGLAQLTASGALQQLDGNEFRVVGPLRRYPGGLTGSESTRLRLAPGVRAPAGAPGHSCVIAADGRVLANPEICQLPDPPEFGS
jgi:hypothetical protein